jgi:hypothetical protein
MGMSDNFYIAEARKTDYHYEWTQVRPASKSRIVAFLETFFTMRNLRKHGFETRIRKL